jgi:hypothetical protein
MAGECKFFILAVNANLIRNRPILNGVLRRLQGLIAHIVSIGIGHAGDLNNCTSTKRILRL